MILYIYIYCGKNNEGIKEYNSKHYLLWTIREILDLFNKEHVNTTYYAIHQVTANEKHICKVGDAADDDCRCEKCENVKLLLTAIKQSLEMENIIYIYIYILGESISTDPNDFTGLEITTDHHCGEDIFEPIWIETGSKISSPQ